MNNGDNLQPKEPKTLSVKFPPLPLPSPFSRTMMSVPNISSSEEIQRKTEQMISSLEENLTTALHSDYQDSDQNPTQ
jgi:hypothetical protein